MVTAVTKDVPLRPGTEALLPRFHAKVQRDLDLYNVRSPHIGTTPRHLVGTFDYMTDTEALGFGEVFGATGSLPVTVSIGVRGFTDPYRSHYLLDYGTDQVLMYVAAYSMTDPSWVHLLPVPTDAAPCATHTLTVSDFEGSRS